MAACFRQFAVGAGLMTMAMAMSSSGAQAQDAGNSDYQAFFKQSVCGIGGSGRPPSQPLGQRCFDTLEPNGTVANISSDSQSSLNPSQVSVSASSALPRARAQSEDAEKRLRRTRGDEDAQEAGDEIASFGPVSLFANVEFEWFDQTRPAFANERGFDGDRVRGTFGFDYRLQGNAVIGAMAHFEDYKSVFDAEPAGVGFVPFENAGSARAKTWSMTVFGTVPLSEQAWLDGAAGLGWGDNRFRRNAVFQPSTRDPARTRPVRTAGKADGKQAFASLGIGYDASSGALSYGPYLRARYVRSTIDAYVEEDLSGTSLNMRIGKQKATSLTTVAGGRLSYAISTSWGVILPEARIEYEHEFKDDPRTLIASFANDPGNIPLSVTSDRPDRNYFNAGAGLVFVLPDGIMPFVNYEGLFGYRQFDRHRLTLGLRLEF